jgi:hypothetical protein
MLGGFKMEDQTPTPVVAVINADLGRIFVQKITNSQLHKYEVWQETPTGFMSVARAKDLTEAFKRISSYLEQLPPGLVES